MSNITKTMDSVFSDCTENELDFDTFFDQEDSLIDTVNGVNEAGEPLTGVDFETLHQTDDNATPKDIEDELGEGHDTKNGSPNPEGAEKENPEDNSVKGEVNKESESDKFINNAEEDYQDDKKDQKPEDGNVTGNIEKVIESGNIDDELDPEEEGVKESANDADKDVKDVVDNDNENEDIDDILDEKASAESSTDLSYELSDEDLIDMAMNNNI